MRVWYTADRSHLVPDGDPRAAFLAAGPGDEVPAGVPWADVEKAAEPVKKPAAKRTAKPKG